MEVINQDNIHNFFKDILKEAYQNREFKLYSVKLDTDGSIDIHYNITGISVENCIERFHHIDIVELIRKKINFIYNPKTPEIKQNTINMSFDVKVKFIPV